MNHVLSSSCAVLSSAPIQATSPATAPPIIATTPTMASATIDHANGVGRKSTTSGPFITRASRVGGDDSRQSEDEPGDHAASPPTNNLVTVDFFTASPSFGTSTSAA